MSKLRTIASFLRWRLVPVRYVTLLLNISFLRLFKSRLVETEVCQTVSSKGFYVPDPVDQAITNKAKELYSARGEKVVPKDHGHPFVNLFKKSDISSENPIFRLAFSPEILDVAADYFGGKFIVDSIQVLHSYSTNGELRESQHWHLDYGDRKSFHAIVYLNDVLDDSCGPFVFVDKDDTKKVGRSVFIRRIKDSQFLDELGAGEVRKFLGKAGAMVYVDPSVCYHYGSRCQDTRLAVFVTFSTWFPFAQPISLITENKEKIVKEAKKVRPDLSSDYLKAILQTD